MCDTPGRLTRAYLELLSVPDFEMTTFANDEGYDELVVVADIPVRSLCEHHMLPFVGVAHVGYVPGDRLLGLSKFARPSTSSPVDPRLRSDSPVRSPTTWTRT